MESFRVWSFVCRFSPWKTDRYSASSAPRSQFRPAFKVTPTKGSGIPPLNALPSVKRLKQEDQYYKKISNSGRYGRPPKAPNSRRKRQPEPPQPQPQPRTKISIVDEGDDAVAEDLRTRPESALSAASTRPGSATSGVSPYPSSPDGEEIANGGDRRDSLARVEYERDSVTYHRVSVSPLPTDGSDREEGDPRPISQMSHDDRLARRLNEAKMQTPQAIRPTPSRLLAPGSGSLRSGPSPVEVAQPAAVSSKRDEAISRHRAREVALAKAKDAKRRAAAEKEAARQQRMADARQKEQERARQEAERRLARRRQRQSKQRSSSVEHSAEQQRLPESEQSRQVESERRQAAHNHALELERNRRARLDNLQREERERRASQQQQQPPPPQIERVCSDSQVAFEQEQQQYNVDLAKQNQRIEKLKIDRERLEHAKRDIELAEQEQHERERAAADRERLEQQEFLLMEQEAARFATPEKAPVQSRRSPVETGGSRLGQTVHTAPVAQDSTAVAADAGERTHVFREVVSEQDAAEHTTQRDTDPEDVDDEPEDTDPEDVDDEPEDTEPEDTDGEHGSNAQPPTDAVDVDDTQLNNTDPEDIDEEPGDTDPDDMDDEPEDSDAVASSPERGHESLSHEEPHGNEGSTAPTPPEPDVEVPSMEATVELESRRSPPPPPVAKMSAADIAKAKRAARKNKQHKHLSAEEEALVGTPATDDVDADAEKEAAIAFPQASPRPSSTPPTNAQTTSINPQEPETVSLQSYGSVSSINSGQIFGDLPTGEAPPKPKRLSKTEKEEERRVREERVAALATQKASSASLVGGKSKPEEGGLRASLNMEEDRLVARKAREAAALARVTSQTALVPPLTVDNNSDLGTDLLDERQRGGNPAPPKPAAGDSVSNDDSADDAKVKLRHSASSSGGGASPKKVSAAEIARQKRENRRSANLARTEQLRNTIASNLAPGERMVKTRSDLDNERQSHIQAEEEARSNTGGGLSDYQTQSLNNVVGLDRLSREEEKRAREDRAAALASSHSWSKSMDDLYKGTANRASLNMEEERLAARRAREAAATKRAGGGPRVENAATIKPPQPRSRPVSTMSAKSNRTEGSDIEFSSDDDGGHATALDTSARDDRPRKQSEYDTVRFKMQDPVSVAEQQTRVAETLDAPKPVLTRKLSAADIARYADFVPQNDVLLAHT